MRRANLAGNIPLPETCFVVIAYCGVRDGHYSFMVDVAVRGMGPLIQYEGELNVAN
jgi:hypothetical protein